MSRFEAWMLHVSNLLGKFGVQRRADLILQAYQAKSMEPARV